MTPTELGEEIATISAHLDAGTHWLLECIRRFDESGEWADQGAASCAHWLAWRVGWDNGTAREKVRVARALGKLPAMDEAFRTAALSYAKVRALTRVATPENEARLLDLALVATGAQLERVCRGYRGAMDPETAPLPEERSVYRRSLPGGKVKVEMVLEPDEADLVMRAVERAREVRCEGAAKAPAGEAAGVSAEAGRPSRADGAVEMAEAFLAGHPVTGSGGERFQVTVHLEQEALGGDGEWAATLEDGSRISPGTLRRVACDCGLVALVSSGGENLNICRRSRTIPPALRRALMVRDRGCAFPGCTYSTYLHAHHIKSWLHGGETSLENTVLACSRHHHMLHEGGWSVERGADGDLLFRSPCGEPLLRNPKRERVEDAAAWMHAWADERHLDLGPEVNFPQWDGSKPDYHLAVCGLLEGP